MAFREMTSSELELLTDSQREIYEKKLEIHRERVKFVEQLEKMEQVEIPSFQPTLNPITPISMAPEKNFVRTEHQITKMPEVKTEIMKVRARPVPPVEKVALPQVPKKVQVRAVTIDSQLPAAPELPENWPLQAPHREFRSDGPVKASVRPAAAVQAPAVSFAGPEAMKADVPAVRKPVLQEPPKVVLNEKTLKPRPVSAAVVLPKTVAFHGEAPKMTVLPAAVTVRPVAASSYAAPEVSAVAVTPDGMAACPEKHYQKPELAAPGIPASVKVRVRESAYHAPQVSKPEAAALPQVKVRVRESAYHVPQVSKTEAAPLPQVQVPQRVFVQPGAPDVQVAYPAVVRTPKFNYEKREYDVQKLPKADAVLIPDPHSNEVLKNLLTRANKK